MSEATPKRTAVPPKGIKRPKRPAAPVLPFQVDPAVESRIALSFAERLRQDLRTGVPGMLVSLCVHLVVFGLLALVIMRNVVPTRPPALEAGWYLPGEDDSSTRSAGPVQIEAVKLNSTSNTPAEKPTEAPTKPAVAGGSVPVQAVDVGNLLGGRGGGGGGEGGGRGGERRSLLGRAGGDDSTARAIESGLSWLVRQQQKGGNWQLHQGYPDAGYRTTRTDTGATALALLPLLGQGQSHLNGQHADSIGRGLQWLIGIQKPNGDFHDHEELGRETAFYAHSQAVIALCEALAMTGDDTLREPAERGVKFLLEAQQPTIGGWKYMPQNEDTVGDVSVTSWALMALHTARAAGIKVPDQPFQRGGGFLDRTQSEGGSRYRFSPSYPEPMFSPAMTGAGIVCRQYLGWPKDHPPMQDGLAWLVEPENLPEWAEGRRHVYGWYFIGQALHNVGGDPWKQWYGHTQRVVLDKQLRTGSNKPGQDVRGSWSPVNPEGDEREFARKGGRLYITAMSLLVLELPYRHMPVYRE